MKKYCGWIVRNNWENGLEVYPEKPERGEDYWTLPSKEYDTSLELPVNHPLGKDLKWEDEPISVIIILSIELELIQQIIKTAKAVIVEAALALNCGEGADKWERILSYKIYEMEEVITNLEENKL